MTCEIRPVTCPADADPRGQPRPQQERVARPAPRGYLLGMSEDPIRALARAIAARRAQEERRKAALRTLARPRKRMRVRRLPTRVFISFDFSEMRFEAVALGQQLLRSPRFAVQNWSLKEAAPKRLWPLEARKRLNRSDVMVIVLNGNTWRAQGVLVEVQLANHLGVPIRQVYPARIPRPKRVPAPSAPLAMWTHANLEGLINVPRRRAT